MFIIYLILALMAAGVTGVAFYKAFVSHRLPKQGMKPVLVATMIATLCGSVAFAKGSVDSWPQFAAAFKTDQAIEDGVLAAESETPKAGAEQQESGDSKEDSDKDRIYGAPAIEKEEELFPAVSLTDAEFTALYGQYDPHLSWNSLTIMAYWKAQLQGFSDGVSLPLYIGVTDWFEEQLGINGEATSSLSDASHKIDDAAILKALKTQAEEWIKEMAALSDEEFAAVFHERFEQEMLSNPVFADMVITQWAASKRFFTANNPWLSELATEFNEAYKSEIGIRYWLEFDPNFAGDPFHYQCTGHDYQKKIGMALMFFENWVDIGVREETSTRNWYLPDGQEDDFMRTALATEQDSRAAFQIKYPSKNGGYLFRIGFNIYDLRLEEFNEKVTEPAKPAETPKTTPKETPKTTPKETPKDPPKNPPKNPPTTPPTTTPDPTPEDGNGGKDPAEEPSHRGDGTGDKGAGDNSQPTDGTTQSVTEKREEEVAGEEQRKQEEEQKKQEQEQIKEEVKDDNGGQTSGGEPPAISTETPDTETADPGVVTETVTETTDNGDGTTTTETTTTTTDTSNEVSDGKIELDD